MQDDFEKHECECSVGDFVCEICDRRFRTDKKLSNHYLKHSQTFDCTLCQHSFNGKYSQVNPSAYGHDRDISDVISFLEICFVCEHEGCDSAKCNVRLPCLVTLNYIHNFLDASYLYCLCASLDYHMA